MATAPLPGQLLTGKGTPLGNIVARVGSVYLRTDGGAGSAVYAKESGNNLATGWIGLGAGGGGGGPADTDALPEGVTNLYFTPARAQAAISVQPSVGLTYSAGVIGLTQDLRSGAAPTFLGTNFTGIVATTGLTATGTKDATTYLRGDNTWAAAGSSLPGGGTTATFLRGDSTWSNILTGGLNVGSATSAPTGGIEASGMIRARGVTTPPSSGVGLELMHDGTTGYVQAYNRATSAFTNLAFQGLLVLVPTGDFGVTNNATVSKGLNVGSATGAAVGQVKAGQTSQFGSGDFAFHDAGVVDSTACRVVSGGGALYLQSGSGGQIQLRTRLGTAVFVIEDAKTVAYTTFEPRLGVNVGTATGAATGEVRASAGVYPGSTAGATTALYATCATWTFTANQIINVGAVLGNNGYYFIHDASVNAFAIYVSSAGAAAVAEVSDLSGVFQPSAPADSAGATGFYWTGAVLNIKNAYAASHTIRVWHFQM